MSETTSKVEPRKLPPDQARLNTLIALSFMHSQGDEDALQQNIFRWIAPYVSKIYPKGYPNFDARNITIPTIHKRIDETRELEKFDATMTATRNWGKFSIIYSEFNKKRAYDNAQKDELTRRIATSIVLIDARYVEQGRKGRVAKKYEPDSKHDPYASFFRKYVLFKEDAGDPAYNDMYQAVGEAHEKILKEQPNSSYEIMFNHLVEQWRSKHPGQKFFPQDEQKSS